MMLMQFAVTSCACMFDSSRKNAFCFCFRSPPKVNGRCVMDIQWHTFFLVPQKKGSPSFKRLVKDCWFLACISTVLRTDIWFYVFYMFLPAFAGFLIRRNQIDQNTIKHRNHTHTNYPISFHVEEQWTKSIFAKQATSSDIPRTGAWTHLNIFRHFRLVKQVQSGSQWILGIVKGRLQRHISMGFFYVFGYPSPSWRRVVEQH